MKTAEVLNQVDYDEVGRKVDDVFNSINNTQQQEFVYKRDDGTVEVARNAEDALRRCPVLGKMAVDQAMSLLELATLGNEVIEKAKIQKDEQIRSDELIKNKLGYEVVNQAKSERTKSIKEVLKEPKNPISLTVKDKLEVDIEYKLTQANEHFRLQEEARRSSALERSLKDSNDPKIIEVVPREQLTNKDTDQDFDQINIEESLGEVMQVSEQTSVNITDIQESLHKDSLGEQVIEELKTSEIMDTRSFAVAQEEQLIMTSSQEPQSVKRVAEAYTNQEYEIGEKIEGLFNQLIELDETTIDTIDLDKEHSGDIETSNIVAEAEDQTSHIDISDIKLYIEEGSEFKGESLHDPVIVLVNRLVETIITKSQELEIEVDSDSIKLVQLLVDIEEAINYRPMIQSGKLDQLKITPEITQNVIKLLQILGYENPQEVMIDIVSNHSVDFLLRIMHYLYQLTHDANRVEMRSGSMLFSKVITDVDSVTSSLGKTLLQLINVGRETLVPN